MAHRKPAIASIIVVSSVLLLTLSLLSPSAGRVSYMIASFACNQAYVGGYPADWIIAAEIEPMAAPISGLFQLDFDAQDKEVSASVFGLFERRLAYRPGYGCGLVSPDSKKLPPLDRQLASGSELPDATSSYPELQQFLADSFVKDPAQGHTNLNHRGIIVLHKGKVIAEHYAYPFDDDSMHYSYSMAKSVLAMLWAIADDKGLADLSSRAQVPEWVTGDPRRAITNRQLMDMSSGLEPVEDTTPTGSFIRMMSSTDTAHFAASVPLIDHPGTVFNYSSGSSNIASRSLALALSERGINLFQFALDELFQPIGIEHLEMLADEQGTFIGGSAIYASLRDWARLGQLLLNDGVWNGRQVLPPGLLESLQNDHAYSAGEYKMGFWLNDQESYGGTKHIDLPDDLVFFAGYLGQRVVILPSHDLVIARVGRTAGKPAIARLKTFYIELFARATEAISGSAPALAKDV